MNKREVKKITAVAALAFFFSFCINGVIAQNVRSFIDRQDILIGEQLQYKVVATAPTGAYNVHWLRVPDSIPHFELVDKSKIDTSTENGNTVLQQTLTLTSFDSGRWNTPAFIVNFDPVKDDTTLNIATDSFAVNVGYAAPDSTNQLRDIKPILDVTITSYVWYYVAAGILLALILGFFLWRYFKNRKKQPGLQFTGKLSPYDEAIQELEKLKLLNLQQPGDTRQFHSRLSAIFKWYISRRQHSSVMNKTTGDVLVHLTGNKLPKETVSEAADALRTGDAVKFAKYLPVQEESLEALKKIKAVIGFINTAGRESQTANPKQ